MSETEYSRLAAQLTEIATDVATIKEKLVDFPEMKQQVNRNETDIKLIKQRCDTVQAAKSQSGVPWGSVKGSILVGIIVGLVMLAANLIIAFAK